MKDTNIIDALNWRYSAKKMTGEQVPQEKIERILEATRLSASSAGLQPYNILVIDNHELKGKIHQQASPQPQIVESSHLLVFAGWDEVNSTQVEDYMQLIADTREIPVASLSPFADSLKGGILSRSVETNKEWAARQAYIAVGTALAAAALEKVDATPMEGFNGAVLDELLGLKEKGLRSLVIIALGYRDETKDFLAKAKKVRRSADSLFLHYN